MAWRGVLAGVSLVTTLALTGGGYVWADAADLVPGRLTARPAPTPPAAPPPEPVVVAPSIPDSARAQVPGLTAATAADPAGLSASVAGLLDDPALGPRPVLSVRDLATGEELIGRDAATAVEPASTTKLITAAAALQVLGADTRLSTQVAWQPSTEGLSPSPALVLIGGGDLLLAAGAGDPDAVQGRVGLQDLAGSAVRALIEGGEDERLLAAGVEVVDVIVDDSLLGAPQRLPREPGARPFAATPSSLAIQAGELAGRSARDTAPARTAGQVFAAAVDQAFADVLGADVTRVGQVQVSAAPVASEQTLVSARSAPMVDVVAHLLITSDNTLADGVAGLVAVQRGQPTSLTSAASVLVEVVESDLGVDLGPTDLVDGSGLAGGSSSSASAITALLVAAATASAEDDIALLPSLLPVAGLEGTLAERYNGDDGSAGGRGVVRAKTGTLTGTTSIAGVTTTRSGRGVAFALLSDQVPEAGTLQARVAVDRVVAALATCC